MMRKTQVRIESVAFKGYGVARVQGKVVFVPHTVTGDEAWIEVMEEKGKYSIGRVTQMVEPSPWRVHPLCPFFGGCGGCHWQHIHYPIQCELKKEIFKDVLTRLGGIKMIPPITVIPSASPFGYRTRIQLRVKGKSLGYFQERSHQVVEIQECPIAHPLVNQIISLIRKKSLFLSWVEEIEINVSPQENSGVLILHPLSLKPKIKGFLKEFIFSHSVLKGAIIVGNRKPFLLGDPTLHFVLPMERLGERRSLRFRVSPGSFSQINPEQNQRLIEIVQQYAKVNQKERILDLYAGVGNLTLPLAIRAKEGWGIEGSRIAKEDACFNAEENGIENCEFIHGKVEQVLNRWEREKPNLLVLDPPRAGCKNIWHQVVRLKPQKIVYVSCDPTTFSRDLHRFSEGGYLLQSLTLIDMFPQTYHMEVVGLLTQSQV